MILLEINEFSPSLLKQAANTLDLNHVNKLLSMHHTKTLAPESQERFGLDPWVQWVSVHTGCTASEHGIAHLAEAHRLDKPQIWEVLDQSGVSSGIWGAMNAKQGKTKNCRFFFPDPWTWTERAQPEALNELLALPRYYSKNYLDLSKSKLAACTAQTAKFFLRPSSIKAVAENIPYCANVALRHGLKSHILFSIFDLISTQLFLSYCGRTKPDFKVLFLNSIAHLQHHRWTNSNSIPAEMAPSLITLDLILGLIFEYAADEPVVVANAFSQECTADNNQYLYRQIKPEKFLRSCGMQYKHLEQMMTNDAHVFFDDAADAKIAHEALSNARLNDGSAPFDVSLHPSRPTELFYQVNFWHDLATDATLRINDIELPLFEHFERVVRRTGSHIREGSIYSSGIDLPPEMMNHELFDAIVKYYE